MTMIKHITVTILLISYSLITVRILRIFNRRSIDKMMTFPITNPIRERKKFCPRIQRTKEYPVHTHYSKPFWVASFPGSGSEMFRSLIEVITGRNTDEIYNHKGHHCSGSNSNTNKTKYQYPIICKTHYPLRIGKHPDSYGKTPDERKNEFATDVMILIRNPAKAIPSHYNYKWEEKNNIKDHSKQGTEQDWYEWRNRRFMYSMKGWKRIITSWILSKHYHVALFIPYEDITNNITGPKLLQQITNVLLKSNNNNSNVTMLHKYNNNKETTTTTSESKSLEQQKQNDERYNRGVVEVFEEEEQEDEFYLTCKWHQVIMNEPKKKRIIHYYEPTFTIEQRNVMIETIDQLLTLVDLKYDDTNINKYDNNNNDRISKSPSSLSFNTLASLKSTLQKYKLYIEQELPLDGNNTIYKNVNHNSVAAIALSLSSNTNNSINT